MNALVLVVGWLILVALSWPLALVALLLAPILWLVCLPFRLAGLVLGALFAFVKTLLLLPARTLGYRG